MERMVLPLPDDALIIPPIFQNMNRDPPCTKNDTSMDISDKVFKNGPSEICGRQPLKNLM